MANSTPSTKLYFVQNIILTDKFRKFFTPKFLSQFNYSMVFSTLASDYLLFTDILQINLFDYLETSAPFKIESKDNPSSSDLTESIILESYLNQEDSQFNFLYFMLSVMFIFQMISFYTNRNEFTRNSILSLKDISLEDMYLYFSENNNIEYYESFTYDRYFYFPMTPLDMFETTKKVLDKFDTLDKFTDYMRSYEQ